jgi:hypothetical protein
VRERREDDALRERFQELRGEAAAPERVPGFASVMAGARAQADARAGLGVVHGGAAPGGRRAPSQGRLFRAGAWASAAVAATVAALLLTDRRPNDDVAFEQLVAAYSADVSAAAWRSPTSGLLDVPGMDLTRSVPSIGSPVRGLDPSTLPPRDGAPREENL